MSWVNAYPEYVAAAAQDLAGIASSPDTANLVAQIPTFAVLPRRGWKCQRSRSAKRRKCVPDRHRRLGW